MADKQPSKKADTKAPKISKRPLWLRYYLDASKPTFLNKTEAARAAGYNTSNPDSLAQIGCQNFNVYKERIAEWWNESGLCEAELKARMLKLLDAKEIKFQTIKGTVKASKLHPSVQILGSGTQDRYSPQGNHYTETENLVGIEVEAIEVQRRTLDMALKAQDLYPSEKHDHNFRGNVTLIMELPPDDGEKPETQEIGKGNGG